MYASVKEQAWEQLREFVTDAGNDSPDASIEAFLIKKTRKKNQFEKFTTHGFQVSDEMAQSFRSIMAESLQAHGFGAQSKKSPKIKRFSDPSLAESGELYFVQKDMLNELNGLMSDLAMHRNTAPIEELDAMANASLYCFEARLEDVSIFVISSIQGLSLKNDQKLVTAAFKRGNMIPIDKNLIHFSRNVLCVYVKSLEALLVFDSSSTVSAMGFKDLFKKKAQSILLDEWTVVNVPAENLDTVLGSNLYNHMLVRIHAAGRLKNDVGHYKSYNEFCNDNPDFDLEPLEIGVNEKPLLTKSRHLEAALHATDNTIVEGVLERGEYSLALRRKPIGKRRT